MVKYPEDWKVVPLGEVAAISRGGSPRPIQAWLTDSADGVNWVKIGDVSVGAKYITATEERIVPAGAKFSREVKSGDFILSNSMSFGRPYILKIDGCIHDGWLAIQEYSKSFDTEYLYYILSSDDVFSQYVAMAAGSSVKNLNKEKVADVKLPLPPLPEQKRIAAVLGNVDKLIDNLSRRIEKKRLVKQGVMQDLLSVGPAALTQRAQSSQRNAKTLRSSVDSAFFASAPAGNLVPRRRLPGFKGEWKRVKLGEVGAFVGGGTPSTAVDAYWDGDIDWYTPAEIGDTKYVSGSRRKITDEGLKNSAARLLPEGTILLTTRASIGLSAILRRAGATNQGFQSLVVNSENDIEFLYYHLSTVVDEMIARASGSTFLEISSSKLKEIDILLPPTLPEQKAIAGVLGAMDGELAKLEAKLEKYRSLKQGLMNDLLTGKVRV